MTEKANEKDPPLEASPERVSSSDALSAPAAGAGEVKAAQSLNLNAHSGSAGGDQAHSVEIVAGRDDGSYDILAQRVAGPVENLAGKQFGSNLSRPVNWEEQLNTGAIISAEAKKNPAVEPVALLKNWAEKLPEGTEKQAYRELAREQFSQVSPEAKQKLERLDQSRIQSQDFDQEPSNLHNIREMKVQAIKGQVEVRHELTNNEFASLRDLPPDTLRKIAQAFEAGSNAGQASIAETADQIIKRTFDAFYSTAKFPFDAALALGKAVWTLLEFERDVVMEPKKAKERIDKVGEQFAIGLLMGVDFSVRAYGYGVTVKESGDYTLPLKHLASGLDTMFQHLGPADQMQILAELGAGFGMAFGAARLQEVQKSGAFVSFLTGLAEHMPRNPEAEARAILAIKSVFVKHGEMIVKASQNAKAFADSFKLPWGPQLETGIGVKIASDAAHGAEKSGFGDNVMAMVRFYVVGIKNPVSAEAAAKIVGVDKKILKTMTEVQLEKYGLESIPAHYRNLFFQAYPSLKGKALEVHHALPQLLLEKCPGLFKAKEVNSVEFLRGIPKLATYNGFDLHDLITQRWTAFFKNNRGAITRAKVLEEQRKIDNKFGRQFTPPVGKR